ncbi:MAG: exodeoxyribonuclease VII small subunit [Lachnospiraceae bacterium]|nr:exodeoxyribonuclease VII small subunit [Lachnospiraceae bacterium]
MENNKKEFNLEEAFLALDETVMRLEQEDISLEESFAEYQKGMELLRKCNEAIDKVEKKVLVLNEKGETDEF